MMPNVEVRLIESLKIEFEMHKHFTTVLVGLGVVLLTILQGFFEDRPYSLWENVFVIGCFAILGFGGLCSIVAMRSVYLLVRDPAQMGNENWPSRYAREIPGYAVLVAILCFFVFAGVYMQRVHGDAALSPLLC